MIHRLRRAVRAALPGLIVGLAACGAEAPDPNAGSGPGGVDTPEALVQRVADVTRREALDELIPLVKPDQRAMLTYLVGVLGPQVVIGMQEGVGGMLASTDTKQAEQVKKKLAALKKDWEELLAKYQIDLADSEASPRSLMAKGKPDPETFDKLLGEIDHQAFLRDTLAFLARHTSKKALGGPAMALRLDPSKASITEDGDTAMVSVEGRDTTIGLVKSDGRWYIDLLSVIER